MPHIFFIGEANLHSPVILFNLVLEHIFRNIGGGNTMGLHHIGPSKLWVMKMINMGIIIDVESVREDFASLETYEV